jgi:polyphosphate glucokinase
MPPARRRNARKPSAPAPAIPQTVLAVDIGGTKVKVLMPGQTEPRKARSGRAFTPARLVEAVRELTADWTFDALAIGYPGQVGPTGPRSEPGNLGPGWVGFDYAAAFGRPVRIINDAAMQALGSYEGGKMLFLGLGTGLGSALIAENVVTPLELGRLKTDDGKTLGDVLGRKGLTKAGKKVWRQAVTDAVGMLSAAFVVDSVVLGGGNAKLIRELPHGARLGHNLTAFRGGFRLWNIDDAPTLPANGEPPTPAPPPTDWRLL